ncbi:universal stress protein [Halococcus agarilyticus]|uniref:universal stress protein n=1 Tax=Halococcus agarilyticus TaxID=1232219 RepID=UPI000677BEF9|nr:universal stress protein [Halococcus agarilyticus]
MDRALVVVDSDDPNHELLREAGTLAAGVGGSLVVLALATEESFEADMETLERIAEVEGTSPESHSGPEYARAAATDAAKTALADIEVDHESSGVIDDEAEWADRIVSVAEERDCDHVFLRGAHRSPTGKALFGDTAQAVILNFDGAVTVTTD